MLRKGPGKRKLKTMKTGLLERLAQTGGHVSGPTVSVSAGTMSEE
jgi:hypothetical protein